jgi:beta-lactamase superfamily II metal-dependent hydrolase
MNTAVSRALDAKAGPSLHVVFHSCGSGTEGGDCIAIRYKIPPTETQVVVIDCGRTATDAEKLIKTIKETFSAETIGVLVLTHSDDDHVKGLPKVLEQLTVKEVWVNDPVNDRITASATTIAGLLGDIASRGIGTKTATLGTRTPDDALEVVGPTAEYFSELFPKIYSDAQRERAQERLQASVGGGTNLKDVWETDSLIATTSSTSASNNASTILLLRVGNWSCLFTGDAGVEAFERAAPALTAANFKPTDETLIQVPHHGSKNNLNTQSATLVAGPIIPEAKKWQRGIAVASVPPDNSKGHPSQRVINAFVRRGWRLYSTSSGPFHVMKGSFLGSVEGREIPAAEFQSVFPPNH